MIKDNLLNANKYYSISPNIKIALEFLKNNDLKNMANGKHQIVGDDIYINIQEYETKSSDNIEAHRKYIDIQYMISGEENIGVTSINGLKLTVDYDDNKDVIFFNGYAELTLVKENEFIILYPEDAHLPCQMVNVPTKVKKAVVKIKI